MWHLGRALKLLSLCPDSSLEPRSVSPVLLCELLSVVKFFDLIDPPGDLRCLLVRVRFRRRDPAADELMASVPHELLGPLDGPRSEHVSTLKEEKDENGASIISAKRSESQVVVVEEKVRSLVRTKLNRYNRRRSDAAHRPIPLLSPRPHRLPPHRLAGVRLGVRSQDLYAAPQLYQSDDSVTLWVNKVGPYNNPQETYNYYSLPFCHAPGNAGHKWGGLGEVLGGNELIDSQIDIKFQKNVEKSTICELELDEAKVKQFKDAIESSYWFEFFMALTFLCYFQLSDLVCFVSGMMNTLSQMICHYGVSSYHFIGFVGEQHADRTSDNKHVLYTHKNIIVKYNKDQIIHVNLTQESPKPLEVGRILDMTYSVKWIPTNITFARRFDVYLDYPFFEHQIHWFSIFNSFMMVIFLTGLVSMILMRTLRNDYAKYAREDDDLETLERDVSEESGWKLVHGDVFRPPRNLVLLSAVVGMGAQLALLVLLVILCAIIGMLYIGLWKHWIKSMILTASLFPFLCFGIGFILNTIAIFYGSLAAIPFGTMVVVFIIWAFISFPLGLLGTVVGRNWSGAPNNPCRVKTIPRPIPEKKWYLTPSVVSVMGGLLPFGSIFIEMYFVFTSFWNYKVKAKITNSWHSREGIFDSRKSPLLTFEIPSQCVLCVWVYAAGFLDSDYRYSLCDNCGNIFLAKC
ncbi:hypothetical protein LguiA_008533 [Lonicera macranthoides]